MRKPTMNEQDWLTSTDPAAMLREFNLSASSQLMNKFVAPSDRKLRLFACACCRQMWHLLADVMSRRAVEVAERYADGGATKQELAAAWEVASVAAWAAWETAWAAWEAAWAAWEAAREAARAAMNVARDAAKKQKAALLRDIIGNPWKLQGLLLDRRWLTPAVVSLTKAAYEERPGRVCETCHGHGDWIEEHLSQSRVVGHSRIGCLACHNTGRIEDGELDNNRLAVLADALDDAGCDNEMILTHLRSEGPHVRGCWVLDLLLGKE